MYAMEMYENLVGITASTRASRAYIIAEIKSIINYSGHAARSYIKVGN